MNRLLLALTLAASCIPDAHAQSIGGGGGGTGYCMSVGGAVVLTITAGR